MDFVKDDNKRKEKIKNFKLLNPKKGKDSDSDSMDFDDNKLISDDEGFANNVGVGG